MDGNIAILAALSRELLPLVRHKSAPKWRRLASSKGTEVWELRHAKGRWLAVCAGMGAERVRVAFAEARKNMPIDAVCSVGLAGALDLLYCAESVCGVSQVVDSLTGERFRPAHWLVDWPVLATSDSVASTAEKVRLAATYGAGLVDMEAATVARLAEANSIPFYCLKAISDEVGEELPNITPYIGADGQLRMLPFLLHIATRPKSWMGLARLGLHSSGAAKNLAESLYDWLDERGYIRREKEIAK